ncbi:hypothetical protein OH77DRAFT_1430582 [Trametes cingulata]|nr:hypothetical protein OH77DRAFT_1430582 [Trametes cingulata]
MHVASVKLTSLMSRALEEARLPCVGSRETRGQRRAMTLSGRRQRRVHSDVEV